MPRDSNQRPWFNFRRAITGSQSVRDLGGDIAMTHGRLWFVLSTAALLFLPIQSAGGADTPAQPAATAVSEEVNFPITCGQDSQKAFNKAVWTLHSFWYAEPLKGFTEIANSEPGCAMAYWGIAMSHWYPLWYPPNANALKAGSAAVDKAMAAQPQTEREKGYIAAIAAFYRDNDKLDHRTRAVAYEKAMEQLHRGFP